MKGAPEASARGRRGRCPLRAAPRGRSRPGRGRRTRTPRSRTPGASRPAARAGVGACGAAGGARGAAKARGAKRVGPAGWRTRRRQKRRDAARAARWARRTFAISCCSSTYACRGEARGGRSSSTRLRSAEAARGGCRGGGGVEAGRVCPGGRAWRSRVDSSAPSAPSPRAARSCFTAMSWRTRRTGVAEGVAVRLCWWCCRGLESQAGDTRSVRNIAAAHRCGDVEAVGERARGSVCRGHERLDRTGETRHDYLILSALGTPLCTAKQRR